LSGTTFFLWPPSGISQKLPLAVDVDFALDPLAGPGEAIGAPVVALDDPLVDQALEDAFGFLGLFGRDVGPLQELEEWVGGVGRFPQYAEQPFLFHECHPDDGGLPLVKEDPPWLKGKYQCRQQNPTLTDNLSAHAHV
jgi:hypothetical protein